MEPRSCVLCKKPLKGRADKRYCDDYCRNTFNNQRKTGGQKSNMVRNINRSLLRNRDIMEASIGEDKEKITVKKDKLLLLGYQFKYFTHQYITKSGNTYNYCYEFGYMPLPNDWYLVVKSIVHK